MTATATGAGGATVTQARTVTTFPRVLAPGAYALAVLQFRKGGAPADATMGFRVTSSPARSSYGTSGTGGRRRRWRPGRWTAGRIYDLFPRLAERKLNRGRQLSGGEQEMLSIGRALLLNPRLLILDEPSQGLAPLIVREVFRIVQQMKAEGISVLLVEQNARMSLEIADDAYVLDDGIVVYSGSARELAA